VKHPPCRKISKSCKYLDEIFQACHLVHRVQTTAGPTPVVVEEKGVQALELLRELRNNSNLKLVWNPGGDSEHGPHYMILDKSAPSTFVRVFSYARPEE
jgi:hypothetical protein